jgi:hypothetical protein
MGQSLIKNPKKLFSLSGGDPSHENRITILENNEYKIAYFTEISSSTGSITIPTGATILLDQLQGGVDAYVCTIQNGQPTGDFPQTGGGVTVDVTSFDALGAYTLSGTPSSYPVALIYILKIKAKDYSNLDITKILDLEDIGIQQQINELDATKQDRQDEVLSGGTVTIGDYDAGGTDNDVKVSATSWYLASTQTVYSTLTDTYFYNIALSSAGLQRFVAFYGDNLAVITKVEGTESEYAVMPATPANSVLIGYILVTDGSLGAAPDLSAYATINPRVRVVASELIPTLNVDTHDELYITTLAGNITSMSTNLTGALANGRVLVFKIKDNGVTRTITWGAKFTNKYVTLPTSTTANKELLILVKYNSATALLEAFAWIEQP